MSLQYYSSLLLVQLLFPLMDMLQGGWPEPVVRVQSLSESGMKIIPDRYIKRSPDETAAPASVNIPYVDMSLSEEEVQRQISEACEDWGFFQVVHHGVPPELLRNIREIWRRFFHQPLKLKQVYANSPGTYEGYGSRLGVDKGAKLDWGDYFFLHCRPECLKKTDRWPASPSKLRELMEEYAEQVMSLGHRMMSLLSTNLGLPHERLVGAFGGREQIGSCLRVNYYPKCPQPDLALGLSPHSDPGGLTFLLPDDLVTGLQVRRGSSWVTVKPALDSFIVNVGDQIQVLSNAKYKSVEHRVVVNACQERLSLAFFYNPRSDLPIGPLPELVTDDSPAMYSAITFDEYRLYIRKKGPKGKSQVESLKSTGAHPCPSKPHTYCSKLFLLTCMCMNGPFPTKGNAPRIDGHVEESS